MGSEDAYLYAVVMPTGGFVNIIECAKLIGADYLVFGVREEKRFTRSGDNEESVLKWLEWSARSKSSEYHFRKRVVDETAGPEPVDAIPEEPHCRFGFVVADFNMDKVGNDSEITLEFDMFTYIWWTHPPSNK